jgi:hypothetical protein
VPKTAPSGASRSANTGQTFYGGRAPLSKVGGVEIKDLPPEEKRKLLEVYRPPGKISVQDYRGIQSGLNENIWNSIPA